MKKEIICTVCPIGCHIAVEGEGDNIISMEGYGCKRGEQYAHAEFAHPVRILTTTVKTDSEKTPLIPVRSDKPVPKEKIMDCMAEIRKCLAKAPVGVYDILIEDVCDTGVNIVATGAVK
ncbi:MAG: DUF1667 domain-containing protein [Ruminococcus sp.]|jgi:CxxC motif-containing protein|nr:DUF1667 domain-containing protein [Ruminococcus sp.]